MDTQENTNETLNTEIENTVVNAESATAASTAIPEESAASKSCDESVPAEVTGEVSAEPLQEEIPADESAVNSDEQPVEEKSTKKRERKHEYKAPVNVTPESMDEVKEILSTMFRYLDLHGEIAIENRGRSVNLLISSEEAGKIIGHHGNNLDSLQTILNRVVQKKYNDYAKIYIDIASSDSDPRPRRKSRDAESGEVSRAAKGSRENHGERRERGGRREGRFSGRERRGESGDARVGRDEKLRMQAMDAAKEVCLFGEAKTLPPMNPHDRRIIHLTLENEAGIVTESIGEGDCRAVVISPKD